MKDVESIRLFKEKLDEQHSWPTVYLFKFIVPGGNEDEVIQLFPTGTTSIKPSSRGKYISVTAKMKMISSDAVVDIYLLASKIDGLISL